MTGWADATVPPPPPLPSIHPYEEPNSPLVLYEGDFSLEGERGARLDVTGEIYWSWLPTPRPRFSATTVRPGFFSEPFRLGMGGWSVVRGERIDARWNWKTDADGNTTFNGQLVGGAVFENEDAPVSSLHFDVPNLPSTYGDLLRLEDGATWRGRRVLRTSEWELTLDELPGLSNRTRMLASSGGYLITHAGRLRRLDGGPMGQETVQQMLQALYYFFTFIRSRRCGPVGARGIAEDGRVVWERWENLAFMPRIGGERSWFPGLWASDADLGSLLSGLLGLWKKPARRREIRPLFHWYSEAARGAGGAEGALVLALTALELCWWLRLGYHATSAERQKGSESHLLSLLEDCGISSEVPTELVELSSLARDQGWSSGAQTVVKLRNALVHPEPKHRKLTLETSPEPRVQAFILATSYLELAILRMLKYHGPYAPRWGDAGLPAPVPWADPEEGVGGPP